MDSLVELSEIQYFYKNKTVLLTGATSFIGKLLLEKILRVLQVKRVYVLLRERDGIDAETRCSNILDSQVRILANSLINISTKTFSINIRVTFSSY